MITKQQALNLGAFCGTGEIHYTGNGMCKRTIGPRGGETVKVTRVRRIRP